MFMQRSLNVVISILFSLIVVGGILFNLAYSDAASASISLSQKHTGTYADNSAPAIPARRDGALLTVADIERYILSRVSPFGPTVSGELPKIVVVQLMTSRDASDVMRGEFVGLPDNALVYYVRLKGPFLAENISLPTGHISSVNLVEEVFSAYTGDMLVSGT